MNIFDTTRHEERIEFLRKEIKEEDGTEMDEESVMDFWYWIEITKTEKNCSLFAIVDSLRAVWQGEAGDDLVGLHFKGGKSIHYVIFKTRYDGDVLREAGYAGFHQMRKLLKDLKLDYLLKEGGF